MCDSLLKFAETLLIFSLLLKHFGFFSKFEVLGPVEHKGGSLHVLPTGVVLHATILGSPKQFVARARTTETIVEGVEILRVYFDKA